MVINQHSELLRIPPFQVENQTPNLQNRNLDRGLVCWKRVAIVGDRFLNAGVEPC